MLDTVASAESKASKSATLLTGTRRPNQSSLHEVVKRTLDELTGRGMPGLAYTFHEDGDAGHRCIETRRISTTGWTAWWLGRAEWAGLSQLRMRRERSGEPLPASG